MAVDLNTTADRTSAEAEPAQHKPVRTDVLRDDRWPDWLATAMFAFAALVVVATFIPPLRRYFARSHDVVSMLTIPIVPNLVYAALLIAVGIALRRRLRAAWWIFVIWWIILPQLARIVSIFSGGPLLQIAGLVIMSAVLVILWRAKPQFQARGRVRNLFAAIACFLAGGVVILLLGTWLVSTFGTTPDLPTATLHVLDKMLGDVGLVDADQVHSPFWVTILLDVLGAAVILASTYLLFKPPPETHTLSAVDEARVRTLLRSFGDWDSLGYFATRRDKSIMWNTGEPATAQAGVSYRVIGSVSLASGNPVGDPQHWGSAIEQWRAKARAHGWSCAVMGAGELGGAAYTEAGLDSVRDRRRSDPRHANLLAQRPRNEVSAPVGQQIATPRVHHDVARHGDVDPAHFDELSASASHWRGDGGDERGFSMALGRLGDPLDAQCVLVEAHDAEGELRAFLSFVPWGRNGLSLDLMRRDPTADNGLVELMVASLAERAAVFGIGRVSLNFAMFREAFERGAELGAGPIARLWRQALVLASRSWQLESLYRSNAKYQPEWQPRYICFEYPSDLPRVGTAAGSAEGFLTRPTLATLRGHGNEPEAGALERAGEEYVAEVQANIPAEPDALAEALSTEGLPEQVRVRREKLERLRGEGVDPYPVTFPRTHTLAQVRAEAGDLPPDTRTGRRVSIAGRVILSRDGGKLCFATLRDGSGDLQVMIALDAVGPEMLQHWRQDVDLGDHVGVTGEVITTKRGELTVRADSFMITSKSIRPLPDKHKGLTDPEARVRARYVDLIVRPEAREVAYARATVVRSVRESLHDRGFTEVETPVLQLIHGGANARPFETHINAYDLDLYLRIATELHLKRLIVGGMEKVFEIGRQFRNEGVDFKHNPEFTSMEVYETYGDYNTMRVLTQQIIQEAATAVYGSPIARRADADGKITEYDFSGDWPVKTICQAVSEALGEEITVDTPVSVLHKHARAIGLELESNASWGYVLEEIYGELCEGQTTTPVFYTDFPKENSPLAREHRDDPRLAEKWDLVIFGSEQGTAYSELTDPLEQRERLVAQSLRAAAGDAEAMQVDEDFLQALEYGMPPTGGMGMGIDRLVMNLTGLGIRETILFPLVKPQA